MAKVTPVTEEVTPAMANANPAEVTPAMAKVNPAMAEVNPAMAKVNPAVAEVTPAVAEVTPAVAEVTPAMAKVNPAVAEVTPAMACVNPAEVTPAMAEVNPAMAEVTPAMPNNEEQLLRAHCARVGELIRQANAEYEAILKSRGIPFPGFDNLDNESLGSIFLLTGSVSAERNYEGVDDVARTFTKLLSKVPSQQEALQAVVRSPSGTVLPATTVEGARISVSERHVKSGTLEVENGRKRNAEIVSDFRNDFYAILSTSAMIVTLTIICGRCGIMYLALCSAGAALLGSCTSAVFNLLKTAQSSRLDLVDVSIFQVASSLKVWQFIFWDAVRVLLFAFFSVMILVYLGLHVGGVKCAPPSLLTTIFRLASYT